MTHQFQNVQYSLLNSQIDHIENTETMSKNEVRNDFVEDNVEMGQHSFKKEIKKSFSENMNTVAHILIIQFVIFILYLAFSHEVDLFSWHPILLSIGWCLFMTEAIMAVSPENWFTKFILYKNRVVIHWVIQLFASACIIAGFVIAIVNKNLKNKTHFKTWHAIFGLVSIVFFVPTCLVGVLTIYKVNLRHYISPKLNKWLHIFLGVATFIFGAITVVLSLYSHWFVKKTTYSLQVVSFIAVVISSLWVLIRPTLFLIRSYIKI